VRPISKNWILCLKKSLYYYDSGDGKWTWWKSRTSTVAYTNIRHISQIWYSGRRDYFKSIGFDYESCGYG